MNDHLERGPGARHNPRPRLELPRNPLVRAVFVGAVGLSGLFSLAMCAAMMAFLGWVFFGMFEDDLATGLVVVLMTAAVVGVSAYIGLRIGLKMRRQSEDFLREYHERMRTRREAAGERDAGRPAGVEYREK